MMKTFFRFLNTVRYLKFKQILYRIFYILKKPRLNNLKIPPLRNELAYWSSPNYIISATKDGKNFEFLGIKQKVEVNWNSSNCTKLWLYNLHYQNELNAIGCLNNIVLCKKLVSSWIKNNPFPSGNGWEPYCISIRIINWIKWLSRLDKRDIDPSWLKSLVQQIDVLDQKLEYHILANHLFTNAKALIFAGTFFGGAKGEQWLLKGLKLLDHEIAEQFLSDGAHYERSPMYHSIMLWDLADLINLEKITNLPNLSQHKEKYLKYFKMGIFWLQNLTHPDQEISFFNDATFKGAPKLEDLLSYCRYLDIKIKKLGNTTEIQSKFLSPSGYAVINWPENHKLLADLAPIGPDYQPGHAHADTLSCEISFFGQRTFVNSGISHYNLDCERHKQRSTASHNTVEIDGKNSTDVWANFRVGRRAKLTATDIKSIKGSTTLTGSHNGYKSLFGGATHRRSWIAKSHSLIVSDRIYGKYNYAKAFWHLHPEIQYFLKNEACLSLLLPKGQMLTMIIEGANLEIVDSFWFPNFGNKVANQTIILHLMTSELETHFMWRDN